MAKPTTTPNSSTAKSVAGASAAVSSSDIRARITSERERLVAEEAHEAQLTKDRLPPLEAGDDAELDAVEARISDSRAAQLRIMERIDLLTSRLSEAEQREERERLVAVRDRADRARLLGEKLIRESYAQQARALAETLTKLMAIDTFIRAQNRELDRAGIEAVAASNDSRHIPARIEAVRRTKRVGIANPEHPSHEAWKLKQGHAGRHRFAGNTSEVEVINGLAVPRFVEVEVVEQVRQPGHRADPLFEVLKRVPAAANGGELLFDFRALDEGDDGHDRLAALAVELGL